MISAAPPPGRLLVGSVTELYGYHIERPRGTRDWLLTYTLAGSGQYRFKDTLQRCHSGDIVLLAPGTPHDYGTAEPGTSWRFHWAHFTPQNEWLPWLAWASQTEVLPKLSMPPGPVAARLDAAFQRCLADNQSHDAYADALAHSALQEILALIGAEAARSGETAIDPRIRQVIDTLAQTIGDPPNVDRLAKMVALSPSRLAHLFKSQTGESMIEMQMKLRLRHAARLLALSALSVSEVAAASGFQSLFQFSRQFKHWYGESPSVYRQKSAGPGRT